MSEAPEPGRRLAAVWFADIVGYTSLSSTDEDAALQVVAVFQRLAGEVVSEHSGRVVKFIGDAALAEFASTDGAIRSALALMERFVEHEAARRYATTLRIGVNVGEVISAPDGDIYGDGVNLASRLQNQAAPGQVVASEAVHAQIRQRPVFRTEPLGQRSVKGISNPVTLYRVTLQESGAAAAVTATEGVTAAAEPPPRTAKVPKAALAAVATVVVVLALVLLDPGGMIGRLTAGAAVEVVQTSYPVVEGGMEIGATVTVEFSGAIDPTTASSANVRLLDARGEAIPAEVSLVGDQKTITLRPRASLVYGADYSLVLGDALQDTHGRTVSGPPVAIRVQPIPEGTSPAEAELAGSVSAGGPVAVRFSEAVDPRGVEEGIHLADERGSPVEATVTLADDALSVRLAPTDPLGVGARYVVRLDSTVVTATGLGVAPDTLTFRVAAAPPPRSAAAQPAAAQTAAPAVTQPAAAAPTTAAPTPTTPARPAPGQGSGPATLNVTAEQVAALQFLRVVVDGDTLGPPPQHGVRVAEGRSHTVTLVGVPELSRYSMVVFTRQVSPQAGQVIDISAQITAFGSIDVVSDPAGLVFVDGRQIGRTPLAGYPVTAEVVHRLEIRPVPADAARLAPYSGEFRVGALEWKSLGRVTLPPKGGTR